MTAGAPWSVKGIDPKAREIAKDLARRSGMTLGEWLNQMIMEDPADGAPEGDSPSAYGRIEAPDHPGDDVLRTTAALERLTSRIEAAEQRTTQAISGVDHSVSDVLARLESAEREQVAVSARFEGAVDDLRTDTARVAERLRRVEQEEAGARSAEAVRSMEAALAKVASHLYDGETKTEQRLEAFNRQLEQLAARPAPASSGGGAAVDEAVLERLGQRLEGAEERTSQAMRGLEASFAQLDARIGAAETRLESQPGAEGGLEQLAASLSARVDAARAEMAEKIREAADGRFERIERTLTEMTGHVQAAENRSAQAIERMGHEVLRMADTLGRRVQEVEHRSSDAIEQVGGEVARLASAMETRLTRTDAASAQALEKLGGEIARITERLAERIGSAERRSAQAIDDIGDQMARVSDRLQDRQEKASTELADRIRQSEERTAKLLEEARERIDQRLGETQRRLENVAQPAASMRYEAEPFPDPDVAPFGRADQYEAPAKDFAPPDSPYSSGVFDDPPLPAGRLGGEPQADFAAFEADDLLEPATFEEDTAHAPAPAFRPFEELESRAPVAPPAHIIDEDETELDIEAAEPAEAAHDDFTFEPEPTPGVLEGEHLDRVLSTRELIDQARAAARAASQPTAEAKTKAPKKPKGGAEGASSLFSGLGLGGAKKSKRRGGSTLATALIISGGAAALGVGLAGYELVASKPVGALPTRVAQALAVATPNHVEQPAPGEPGHPMAAVALSTTTPRATSALSPALPPAPSAQASEAAAELYADAVRRIDARDFSGLTSLRKSANLGYPPAQFYLGKLFETGGAGLTKDLVQARQWTERAAEAGDKKAMHNLALYYFEGSGGPKDLTQAAEWFRRASQLGLVDSQFNLAQLYQEGIGVARNPAEAYKWYLIAARQGDAQSRTAAQALKGQLTPEAQATAERAADGFQSETVVQTAAGQPAASPGSGALVTAQRALSRLGYYQGPYDGQTSPALSLAIAAYQRDQGLPSTGALDATVNGKLAVLAQ